MQLRFWNLKLPSCRNLFLTKSERHFFFLSTKQPAEFSAIFFFKSMSNITKLIPNKATTSNNSWSHESEVRNLLVILTTYFSLIFCTIFIVIFSNNNNYYFPNFLTFSLLFYLLILLVFTLLLFIMTPLANKSLFRANILKNLKRFLAKLALPFHTWRVYQVRIKRWNEASKMNKEEEFIWIRRKAVFPLLINYSLLACRDFYLANTFSF